MNLRKRFSFIFNVLLLYFECFFFFFSFAPHCQCVCVQIDTDTYTTFVYLVCLKPARSCKSNVKREPFSCCIYYICLKTCHVGIYLVNQIMPRNDMLMKWQSVYTLYRVVFVLLLLLHLSFLCFMFFFLTKIQWEMQKHFPLHEILFISAMSRKFKKKNKKDGCHSFNAWWPIFKITSA